MRTLAYTLIEIHSRDQRVEQSTAASRIGRQARGQKESKGKGSCRRICCSLYGLLVLVQMKSEANDSTRTIHPLRYNKAYFNSPGIQDSYQYDATFTILNLVLCQHHLISLGRVEESSRQS
ncbi:hypothetical protein KQX54_018630 [Cotesia glomerata]|uniref:Uncharacterized protein n=1 Tax=Cotesia glomerata TaxID=32391 RepID=A0AAV7I1K5_COTGL|nr:hypothetical protein KQX54_018630 [Cotesia glomerata]